MEAHGITKRRVRRLCKWFEFVLGKSQWTTVAPLHLLFSIYINNLEIGINSKLYKLTNDNTLLHKAN